MHYPLVSAESTPLLRLADVTERPLKITLFGDVAMDRPWRLPSSKTLWGLEALSQRPRYPFDIAPALPRPRTGSHPRVRLPARNNVGGG